MPEGLEVQLYIINVKKTQFYGEPLCGPPSYDLIEEKRRVYSLTVFMNHPQ